MKSGAKGHWLCPSVQALEREFGKVVKEGPESPRAVAQDVGEWGPPWAKLRSECELCLPL